MAITAYTGLPRSGKSYSAIEQQLLPALRDGRRVATNIPICMDVVAEAFPAAEVYQVDNAEIAADGFFARPEWVGAVMVLDELWRLWPSGLKANNASEEHKAFLAEHGHMVDSTGRTTQIVLITQDLSQVAAWVRALVASTYRTTKLSAVGSQSRYRCDVYEGPVTGPSPPKAKRVNELFGKYEERVWRYYKSAMHSQTGEVGQERALDKRGSLWRNKRFLACVIAPAVLFAFLLPQVPSLFDFGDQAPPPAPAAAEPAPAPVQVAQTPVSFVPAAAPPQLTPVSGSVDWRLAGVITDEEGDHPQVAVLVGEAGVIRRVDDPECQHVDTLTKAECVIGGELVAAWTGPQFRSVPGRASIDTTGRVRDVHR